MTLADACILFLAAWYIQYCLRWLKGPFGIFDWIRLNIGRVRVVEGNKLEVLEETFFSDVWKCVYCMGFWVGLALTPIEYFAPVVLWPFAAAGAIALIEAMMRTLWR